MRIAYSTNAYTRFSLDDALERIAALGFDGAEILCDKPHWFPEQGSGSERYNASVASMVRLRERLDALGLRVSNLNCNTANGYFEPVPPENCFEPSLASAREDWRRWRLDYSLKALSLAARLGARTISVTSGRPDTGGTPERSLDLLTDSLCRLCEAAEPLDLQVGIEYEPGLLIERADELLAVMERVGSPRLGANLDIGHAWLAGETPETAVAPLAGRIWNVHVEDIRARKHYHLIPGEGDLPLGAWLAALDATGYTGFYTVELYTYTHCPDEAGRRSLDYFGSHASWLGHSRDEAPVPRWGLPGPGDRG